MIDNFKNEHTNNKQTKWKVWTCPSLALTSTKWWLIACLFVCFGGRYEWIKLSFTLHGCELLSAYGRDRTCHSSSQLLKVWSFWAFATSFSCKIYSVVYIIPKMVILCVFWKRWIIPSIYHLFFFNWEYCFFYFFYLLLSNIILYNNLFLLVSTQNILVIVWVSVDCMIVCKDFMCLSYYGIRTP